MQIYLSPTETPARLNNLTPSQRDTLVRMLAGCMIELPPGWRERTASQGDWVRRETMRGLATRQLVTIAGRLAMLTARGVWFARTVATERRDAAARQQEAVSCPAP